MTSPRIPCPSSGAAAALSGLLALALASCARPLAPVARAAAPAIAIPRGPIVPGEPAEQPPPRELFDARAVASLFSHPGPLDRSDAQLGAEWKENGTVVWAVAFSAADETFAPVTLVLFDGRYRGMVLNPDTRALLRSSDAYHDLDFGGGRKGYAMRAGGLGGALETASIPSPRGRFELLVIIDVPAGGPKESKGAEAYRSLLLDYPVRLIEGVARGIERTWAGAGARR